MSKNSQLSKGEESRNKILATAEAIFARKGYAATRLDDISEVTGLSRPTLLFYFKDKPGLYRAVMESLLETRQQSLTYEDRDQFERLEDFLDHQIDNTLDYYVQHPEYPMMLMRSLLGDGPESDEESPASFSVDAWSHILEEANERTHCDVSLAQLLAVVAGSLTCYMLFPQGPRSGQTPVSYDPAARKSVAGMKRTLQRALRGLLGLEVE